MRKLTMLEDKKGAIGLETVKAVMIVFLLLSVLAVTIILALSSLKDTEVAKEDMVNPATNETTTSLNETGYTLNNATLDQPLCSVFAVYNQTGGVLATANYTTDASACTVTFTGDDAEVNNTIAIVWYRCDYQSNEKVDLITKNVSSAVVDFFSNTTTIFAILVVVVIILAIAIIIYAVSRFGAGGGAGGAFGFGGRSAGGGDLTEL